jgi:MarR family transcriptional regulator, organic hydroperoxide resistance regulator
MTSSSRNSSLPPAPNGDTPLGGVLDFLKLLWAVDHGLQKASREMEGRLGVTGPQRMVIRIVGRFPGIFAGDLAAVLHVHPSTLTGILRRLETRRILHRIRDPKDGRRAHLYLSPLGKRLDAVRTGTVEAVVAGALENIPKRRIEESQMVLRELVKALSPISRPGG